MTLTDRFAANLRSLRAARGMTQADLASAAGVAAGYVSMLERGQRAPPLDTVERIAGALGVSDAAIMLAAPHGA